MLHTGIESTRKFSEKIVEFFVSDPAESPSWIDATVAAAEFFDVDVGSVKQFLTRSVREKLETEFIERKMIRGKTISKLFG